MIGEGGEGEEEGTDSLLCELAGTLILAVTEQLDNALLVRCETTYIKY